MTFTLTARDATRSAYPLTAPARLIRTPAFNDIADAADLVVPDFETAVIHGRAGTGKYTAAVTVLGERAEPLIEVDLEPGMSSKDLARRLYRAVVGHDDISERDLQDDLVRALAAQPRIVLVRRADRLTREAAGQLQWLHARPGRRWALFLLGGPGTGEAIAREAHLRGSVLRTIEVQPLHGAAGLHLIQQLHPLLRDAKPNLVKQVDDHVCHGVLRHWHIFLRIAQQIARQAEAVGNPCAVLTEDLAQATVSKLPSTVRKAPRR